MQTIDFQNKILAEIGIKTSVKKGNGSNKCYLIFSPMYQNGKYPEYPFEWRQSLLKDYPETEPPLISVNATQIHLHKSIIEGDAVKFKKEKKPLPFEQMKQRQWGSKNSQMRLDKASRRAAKIPLWQKQ